MAGMNGQEAVKQKVSEVCEDELLFSWNCR